MGRNKETVEFTREELREQVSEVAEGLDRYHDKGYRRGFREGLLLAGSIVVLALAAWAIWGPPPAFGQEMDLSPTHGSVVHDPGAGQSQSRFRALSELDWRDNHKELFRLAVEIGYERDINPHVLTAIAWKESTFRWSVDNGTAACIMQVNYQLAGRPPARSLVNDKRYCVEKGAEIFHGCLERYRYDREDALQCYRGLGYEPSYPRVVSEKADQFEKEWKAAKIRLTTRNQESIRF